MGEMKNNSVMVIIMIATMMMMRNNKEQLMSRQRLYNSDIYIYIGTISYGKALYARVRNQDFVHLYGQSNGWIIAFSHVNQDPQYQDHLTCVDASFKLLKIHLEKIKRVVNTFCIYDKQ